MKTDKDGLNKRRSYRLWKGECDDLATITINGETREINLKNKILSLKQSALVFRLYILERFYWIKLYFFIG
jgi:hypothetical protein